MTPPEPQAVSAAGVPYAGTMLREAREAAGLSIDMVSQQLKLHPRQVRALEEGDYAQLPGRTFVRGFARNYARLLQLDPQVVLDALPGAAGDHSLDAPPLNPTAVTMGELPSDANRRPVWLLWLLLIVVIAGFAMFYGYQHYRRGVAPAAAPEATSAPASAPAPATAAPAQEAASTGAGTAPAGSSAPALSSTGTGQAAMNAPSVTVLSEGAAQPGGSAASGATAPQAGAPQATAPEIAPIAFAVRASSWIEVKDSTGHTLLSQNVAAGQTQVLGTPPFEVTIGNASGVTLSYRGSPVDLSPYVRGNVARLTLK